MAEKRIGLAVAAKDSMDALAKIRRAEALGVSAAWLTTGGARMDALTLFSAAAVQTQRILLGTSIIPTWPRHPIAVAQQAQVLAQLSNGRFRLGFRSALIVKMQIRKLGCPSQKELDNSLFFQAVKEIVKLGSGIVTGNDHRAFHANLATGNGYR